MTENYISISHWGMFKIDYYVPHVLDMRAVYQANSFGDLD